MFFFRLRFRHFDSFFILLLDVVVVAIHLLESVQHFSDNAVTPMLNVRDGRAQEARNVLSEQSPQVRFQSVSALCAAK